MDYQTLFSLVGGVAIAITLVALFMKSKTSINVAKWSAVVGVIGLLTLIPVVATNLPFLSYDVGKTSTLDVGNAGTTSSGTTGGVVDTKTSQGIGCIYDGLSATISGKNHFTGGATGGTNAYRLIGSDGSISTTKTVSDGGSVSVNFGQKLQVMFGNESNTFAYYGKVQEFPIPCEKYPQIVGDLYQNGTLKVEVLSNKGQWTTDQTTNFSGIGANDVRTTDLRISGQTNKGTTNGYYLVIEYNKTAFDKLELRSADDTSAYPSVGVPTVYPSIATGRSAVVYDINSPIIGSGYNNFKLLIDASSNGPTTALPDAGINMTIETKAPYFDDNNGGAFAGPSVVDENNRQNYLYNPVFNFAFTS